MSAPSPEDCDGGAVLQLMYANSTFRFPGFTVMIGGCCIYCTSQEMQQPPFMTIKPGDVKVEFVYINCRTGPPSQSSGDGTLIGPWA